MLDGDTGKYPLLAHGVISRQRSNTVGIGA